MLNPDRRSLYTDALRPPLGFGFDEGLATTYSLDLTTLLAIPVHLALFGGERSLEALRDSVAVLESLRRTARKLNVYCQESRIHIPGIDQVLYGLLEPIVHEVQAPGGGSFHAKLWVLRFVSASDPPEVRLRVLVLTRNLTYDRSWDVSLQLDGEPGSRRRRRNAGLERLVRSLPDLARRAPTAEARAQAERLADEVARADWELPEGFDDVVFRSLGLGGRRWPFPESDQLAVISPFCDERALRRLEESTDEFFALISTSETLEALEPRRISSIPCFALADEASVEDGEDVDAGETLLRGLHAKVYALKQGWETRLIVGSANATDRGLFSGRNVELLAELTGKASRIGRVEDLIGDKGLGDLIQPFAPGEHPSPTDAGELDADRQLDAARSALAEAGLRVVCRRAGDGWRLALESTAAVALGEIATVTAWPISLNSTHAVDAQPLSDGEPVDLGGCALASITGLIAFDLTAQAADRHARFVLNLPLVDLPSERDAAVTRLVIANREGFLRYLLLLLAELGEDFAPGDRSTGPAFPWWRLSPGDDSPLLEQLVRALARDPDRLRAIHRLVEDLEQAPGVGDVIPPEFRKLWPAFAKALEERSP